MATRWSPRCTGALAEPPAHTCSHRWNAFRRDAISPAQYVATYREIEPLVALIDQQSQASAGVPGDEQVRGATAMAFAAFVAPVDVAVVEGIWIAGTLPT